MGGGRKFRLTNPRKNHESELPTLPVKLPLLHFFSVPATSLQALKRILNKKPLPPLWSIPLSEDSLLLWKINISQGVAPFIKVFLRVCKDLKWNVSILYQDIPHNVQLLQALSPRIKILKDLLIDLLDDCQICCGNSEERLVEVIRHKESTSNGMYHVAPVLIVCYLSNLICLAVVQVKSQH